MGSTRHDALAAVRRICAALPETNERLSHGAPTFFVRDKKMFATLFDDHHGDGMLALWFAAPPGVQEQMVEAEPERYFRPPYVGHRGWLGLRLDVDRDDEELVGVLTEAYRCIAPKGLVAQLEP